MEENTLQDLIEEIAPLNNLYRMATRNREPAHMAIGYLWDIGDVLVRAGVREVHPLAREIQERSYITSDLLSYAFRIRRYFNDRRSIKRRFGKTRHYSVFREAFPLLENRRYRLTKKEESNLVRLMNSGEKTSEIRREIAALKQAKNPRQNTRAKRLEELRPFASIFRCRLEEMETLLGEGARREIHRFCDSFTPEFLLFWNRLSMALADETFAPPQAPVPVEGIKEEWAELVQAMYRIAAQGRAERNRARRLVGSMEFLKMAGYVDLLRDRKKLDHHLRKRKHLIH